MRSIAEIRDNAQHLVSNDEMRIACLKIIDTVNERWRAFESIRAQKLTIGVLSKWTELSPSSKMLRSCIQLLSSSEDVKLFDVHFILFDPNNPDDIGIEIDDEDVAAAYGSGFIHHPETDQRIENFESVLAPYFTIDESVNRESFR